MATTKKPATTKKAPAKPRAAKAPAHPKAEHKPEHKAEETTEAPVAHHAPAEEAKSSKGGEGRYFYAVGRRKTSVANVRMFMGKAKSQVNKRDPENYFGVYMVAAMKPLQLTGMENQVHVYSNIKGGGIHSQAQALAHGIAQALVLQTPDFRKVLKKNGMLTRDSRMKERKKPGLKRARRGPQWAKR